MQLGRTLIVIGLVVVGVGLLVTWGARLPFRIGRLPGDIVIRGKSSTFYFPIATSILLSVVGTLAFWLWNRR